MTQRVLEIIYPLDQRLNIYWYMVILNLDLKGNSIIFGKNILATRPNLLKNHFLFFSRVESSVMLIIYIIYVIVMWKNQWLEKAFYLYAGYLDTYEERFGKLKKEEEGENEEEHLLTEKERILHEKCLNVEKDIYDEGM